MNSENKELLNWAYYGNLAYRIYNADNLSNDGVRFGCLFSLLSINLAKNGLKNTGFGDSPLVLYILNLALGHLAGSVYDYSFPQEAEELKDSFSQKLIQGATANALFFGVSELSTSLASSYLPGYQLGVFSALWLTSAPVLFVGLKKTQEYIDINFDIDLDYYAGSAKNIYSTDILSNDGLRFGYVIAGLTTHTVMTVAHKKGFPAEFAIFGSPVLATTSVYLAGLGYDYFYSKDKEEAQDSFYKESLQFAASSSLFASCVMLTNNLADKYFPQEILHKTSTGMLIRKIPQEQNKYASVKLFSLLWVTSMASAYFATNKAEEYFFPKIEEDGDNIQENIQLAGEYSEFQLSEINIM